MTRWVYTSRLQSRNCCLISLLLIIMPLRLPEIPHPITLFLRSFATVSSIGSRGLDQLVVFLSCSLLSEPCFCDSLRRLLSDKNRTCLVLWVHQGLLPVADLLVYKLGKAIAGRSYCNLGIFAHIDRDLIILYILLLCPIGAPRRYLRLVVLSSHWRMNLEVIG